MAQEQECLLVELLQSALNLDASRVGRLVIPVEREDGRWMVGIASPIDRTK